MNYASKIVNSIQKKIKRQLSLINLEYNLFKLIKIIRNINKNVIMPIMIFLALLTFK